MVWLCGLTCTTHDILPCKKPRTITKGFRISTSGSQTASRESVCTPGQSFNTEDSGLDGWVHIIKKWRCIPSPLAEHLALAYWELQSRVELIHRYCRNNNSLVTTNFSKTYKNILISLNQASTQSGNATYNHIYLLLKSHPLIPKLKQEYSVVVLHFFITTALCQ